MGTIFAMGYIWMGMFFNFDEYMNGVGSGDSSRTSVPKIMASNPPPPLRNSNLEDKIPRGGGIHISPPVAWYWLGLRESTLAHSVEHWSFFPKGPEFESWRLEYRTLISMGKEG